MPNVDSKAHDLFLLLLNLSQFTDREKTIQIFLDALKKIWPNFEITFSNTHSVNGPCFEIASRGKLYGCIIIEGNKDHNEEDLALLHNAAAMLAVILRKQEQDAILSREAHSLKIKVQESSEQLESVSRRYDLTRQTGKIAVWERSVQSDRIEYSPEFERILGLSPGTLNGSYESFLSKIHSRDRSEVNERIKNAERVLQGYSIEYRIIVQGGAVRWVRESGEFFPDKMGNLNRIIGTFHDITEIKMAEEKLRQSEEMHRMLFEHAGVGIAYFTIDGDVISFNAKAAAYMGGKPGDYIGLTLDQLYGEEFGEKYKNRLVAAASQEGPLTFEDEVELSTGTFWFQSVYNSIRNSNGDVSWVQIISSDITRIKQLELSLKDSIRRTKQAVTAGNIALWEWDIQKDSFSLVYDWKDNLGYETNQTARGFEDFLQYVHPEDKDRVRTSIKEFLNGKSDEHKLVYRMQEKSGKYRWFMTQASLVKDSSGEPVKMQGTHIDISEQKESEENIKKALAENRVLLRELHHRTKNNLQLVTSMLRLKAMSIESADMHFILDEIEQKIHSIALVHEKLYESENFALIRLQDYICDVTNLFAQSFKEGERALKMNYECEDISVAIDIAIPIGLVLNEIVTNAVKYAFPERATGTISIKISQDKSRNLQMICKDDGSGVKDIKNLRNRAGIGLETIFGLVEKQLGGSVELKNESGLKYEILIPLEYNP